MTPAVTYADALAACVAAFGEPTISYRNPARDGAPAYAVTQWEPRPHVEVELHEEAPGVAAPHDVYIIARIGSTEEEWALHGTPTPDDSAPLTPLPDAIAAAGAWLRGER